jgi:hypothetical protein
VFLGEYHRIRDDVELVRALIPTLHRKTGVRHLALELLCRERTEEANRLISAETYDRRAVIDFYRNQHPNWSYAEYVGLFRTAWESNRAFAAERGPFRFVGLGPCVDWETIHFGDEAAAQRERELLERYDKVMAETLETRVLEPGHSALVFTGVAHSTAKFTEYRYGTDEPLVRMGNLVRRAPYADDLFFIAFHAPFWDAGSGRDVLPFDGVLDRLMRIHRGAVGFDVAGTPFGRLTHADPSPRSITAHRFGELFDGYVMHAAPLDETEGVTCITDWIETAEQLRHFARNLSNRDAVDRFLDTSLEDFQAHHCAPRPEHGIRFGERFEDLIF